MPEQSNRFKLIAIFSLIALPGALLLITGWVISENSAYLKTSGQMLLVIILALLLTIASGFLSFLYIAKKYLNPIRFVSETLRGIQSHTFKPLPQTTQLGIYQEIYNSLVQIQTAFSQNQQFIDNLNNIVFAQNKLLETSIFEVADPIILLNSKYEVKYVNFATENFTGVKKLDVTGKRVDQFVKFYDKTNKEILVKEYLAARTDNQNPKVFFAPEIKIISSVNRESFADITVFRPDQATILDTYAVILLHDRTVEKQLEAMKLDFVSMAAHELRTPLTSIKGYISVFINENQDKLTPEQLMFIRRINTSTQQLSGLVENLLSVARVERGALTLHSQIIDWVSNVSAQAETFLHRAEEKRITLTYIKPNKPIPKVAVDLVRINEVLNNIISNAINYTEPQGKIEVWIDTQNGEVITYVKDSGKGIPKEALAHLFSKFFRVAGGSAEQASKGNGLGLYLSKAIVELHNGKIWALSEGVGKGSTFAFSLPSVKDTIDISVLTKAH